VRAWLEFVSRNKMGVVQSAPPNGYAVDVDTNATGMRKEERRADEEHNENLIERFLAAADAEINGAAEQMKPNLNENDARFVSTNGCAVGGDITATAMQPDALEFKHENVIAQCLPAADAGNAEANQLALKLKRKRRDVLERRTCKLSMRAITRRDCGSDAFTGQSRGGYAQNGRADARTHRKIQ